MIDYIINKRKFKYFTVSLLISFFFGNFYINKEIKANENITPEYLLGPTDVLTIKYKTAYFFTKNYMVNVDGRLDLPEIGKINVEGLTVSELENLLEEKYQSIIKSPEISISISKYRPLSVYILTSNKQQY